MRATVPPHPIPWRGRTPLPGGSFVRSRAFFPPRAAGGAGGHFLSALFLHTPPPIRYDRPCLHQLLPRPLLWLLWLLLLLLLLRGVRVWLLLLRVVVRVGMHQRLVLLWRVWLLSCQCRRRHQVIIRNTRGGTIPAKSQRDIIGSRKVIGRNRRGRRTRTR